MSQLSKGKSRRLMYIEQKSGFANDDGPARIGWVTFSKTERTIYHNDRAFQRIKGGGIAGNYVELETGDEYWISGVKATGSNRHIWGSGKVPIDADAIDEYKKIRAT